MVSEVVVNRAGLLEIVLRNACAEGQNAVTAEDEPSTGDEDGRRERHKNALGFLRLCIVSH
jgi:hypothetical protein